jgi:hypothetical protein
MAPGLEPSLANGAGARLSAVRVSVGGVTLTQSKINELWGIACADAGYSPDEPIFVLATTASVLRGERNAYFDPTADLKTDLLPLTSQELDRLSKADGRHRVVVAADADEPQMLALMRWGLEHAVQFDQGKSLMHFYGHVLNVLSTLYRPLGAGSALLGNLIPGEEDANAASAALVRRTLGPQFGQLYGPFGPLFRPAEKGSLDTLPKRMVVFAALHPEAFKEYAGGTDYQRDVLLSDVDQAAPEWWQALLADGVFAHFRALIPYFTPTAAELAAASPPAEAWRPLAELLRRGQLRGTAVLP